MNFNEYLTNAWATHPTEARKIADEFKSKFALMKTEDDVMAIARLIVHVCGEHLGDWELGIDLLRKLKNNATIKDKAEMNRLVAILSLGNFPTTNLDNFSHSDQARIYCGTSSALASLGGLKNSEKFLSHACELVEKLETSDPANKSLAMAANNIACALEEKENRNQAENDFMVFAANVARRFWEIAGTWKEVERAEYRLCQTYLKVSKFEKAKYHAEKCLEIVLANQGDALEQFFAYEASALVEKANDNLIAFDRQLQLMSAAFDQLTPENQEWCRQSLDKLK